VVEAIRPGALPGEGDVVDASGRPIGRHPGVHHFTIGQRRGLRIAAGERLYVTGIDAARNRVQVGSEAELGVTGARVERVSWIAGAPPAVGTRARVRVRYRHEGADAALEPCADGSVRVHFDAPVRAVAPGQAAVFDAGDVVLGGGWLA
jgi:tRNA-specific 2-thiouridylase